MHQRFLVRMQKQLPAFRVVEFFKLLRELIGAQAGGGNRRALRYVGVVTAVDRPFIRPIVMTDGCENNSLQVMHVRLYAENDAQLFRCANGVVIMRRLFSQIFKI